MQNRQKQVQIAVWLITFVSVLLAYIAWGQSLNWHIFGASTYLLFPIFGLFAFSILWSQYISLVLRDYFKLDKSSLSQYFSVTGWLVLVAILLHPGLLIWQIWRDGGGFPPSSELHYVLPSLKGIVILGMINLTVLLLFELRRVFAKQTWWRYFTYVVDLVVLLAFYHGLRLGSNLQTGWYRSVWFFYGISFVSALAYIYMHRYDRSKQKKSAKISVIK